MLALGARLAERGHDVTFETWDRWRAHVEANNMRFLPAPEHPVFPTREVPLRPYEAVVMSTRETAPVIAALAPDVVVHDILTLAPALAAELHEVPVATLVPHVYPQGPRGAPPYAFGARLPRTELGRRMWSRFERPVQSGLRRGRGELNETRRRLGLPPVTRLHGGLSEQLTIVATFPQLEYPRHWPPSVHVIGPLLWEPPYEDIAPPVGSEPLVVIAPSTAQDREQRLLRAAVEGLRAERVRVLATWNRRPPAVALTPGPNTRVVEWVSYSKSMASASLVVCHAGHGTMVRALACGSPVVAVPHSGDMAENAARADWAGVGVRLPWRLLSPATLRLAIRRALKEHSIALEARRFASWSAANDAARRAAELVEGLAGS